MSVKVIYSDIALGADEDAAVTTTAAESFSEIDKIPFGVATGAVATLELNSWGLVPEYKVKDKQPFAFWSIVRSGVDCVFSPSPAITLEFDEQYTATALTVKFAVDSVDFCSKFTVNWYQNGVVKDTGTYYPDKPVFVVNKAVEAFDKLEFIFEETRLPGRRCKVEQIMVGVIREFGGDELKSVHAIHEVDLISETVPVNVLDAEIHSNDNIEFITQKKQPVQAYIDDALIGVYYIERGQRTGAVDYSISCQDAIGLLDLVTQPGGIWFEDTPLATILSAVFGDTVEFDIDQAYSAATLRGFIEPETTMREALQQIVFALGAVVDTSGTSKVKIFPPPSGTATAIDPKNTYTGGVVSTADTVTEVTVTAYVFSNERPGDNDEYIEFNGVQYRYYTETKHAYNPNVVSTDPENVKNYTGMYLCNLSNAQAVADGLMSYHMRRDTYAFKHVVDGEAPAERHSSQLPWGGTPNGNITKMSITASGITVSETEMRLD